MGISATTSSAFAWDFAEHRKIGDRAMSLLPRYLVENGIFPNEAVADSALLQILNMSHMPGSNAYAMNELTQLPNIVTYGTLCGLAGDHVENPMLLETGLQTHFSKTNRTLALETQAMNEFLTGANSKELLDINLDRIREGFWSYLPLGSIIAFLMVVEMGLVLGDSYFRWFEHEVPQAEAGFSNVKAVGRLLFTEYVYPFELASVILLVGIVAAVALTVRGKRGSKSVSPLQQVFVKAKDRVRVLKMSAEKNE